MENRIDELLKIYKSNEVCKNGWRHGKNQREKLLYYREYYRCEKDSLQIRRAKAEAYLLKTMKPVINPFELIAGASDYSPLTNDEKEELNALENKISKERKIQSTGGHMALDFSKLLHLGVNGLISEIESYKTENKDKSKELFYESCLIELNAVKDSASKYSDYAFELAKEADTDRKKELQEIGENLRNVPSSPAHNFYEAVQSIHFFMYSLHNLFYYGRIDQYLYPYYKKDLDEGNITYEYAQELIDCLFLGSLNYSCRAGTGATVGGLKANGTLVENDITKMVIQACADCQYAANIIGFAITENTNKQLLENAVFNSCKYQMPLLFNDEKIRQSFVKYGISKYDSFNWANTGCLLTVAGKCSGFAQAKIINLPILINKCLERNPTNDSFMQIFQDLLEKEIQDSIDLHNQSMIEREKYGYEVLRISCLIDDCFKNGKSHDQGGGRYCLTMPNIVGFANTINSIYTIRKYVFDEKRYTCKELMNILNNNFIGYEEFRQNILSGKKYGRNSELNSIANEVVKILENAVNDKKNYFGGQVAMGTFAYIYHAIYGRQTGATADGRLEHIVFSNGLGPSQGDESTGAYQSLLASTSFDQTVFLNTPIYNCTFDDNFVTLKQIVEFMKNYFRRGGKMFLPMYYNLKKLELDLMENEDKKKEIFYPIGPFDISIFEMEHTEENLINDLKERNIHKSIN